MANKKLLNKAEQLGLETSEDESDEDLLARINEAQNANEHFDPTADAEKEPEESDEELSRDELLSKGLCPDCKGQGIRNPAVDHHVCQTCEGSGKA